MQGFNLRKYKYFPKNISRTSLSIFEKVFSKVPLNSSFDFVFWGLLTINWIFGIFVFILTKGLIKKEIKKIDLIEQTT